MAAAAQGPTIVSLTFDDGWADQYQGLAMLNAHGMHATYFLNSPRISGDSAYMTWSHVADLAAAGNEIGGHTAYHADLPFIDPTEAQRQICYDRDNLLQRGYNVTNFAFPYGDFSPAVKTMVQNCGYNSARTTDVFPQANPSGPIPPPDPYQIDVGTDDDDADLDAERRHRGAPERRRLGADRLPPHLQRLQHQLHHAASDFNTFLDWLQGQAANSVVVKTMQEVLGGCDQPAGARSRPAARAERDERAAQLVARAGLERRRHSRLLDERRLRQQQLHTGRARATPTPAPGQRS